MKEDIEKAREKLRDIYNKYIKEFYEINKKIDEYLEALENK
jgi:hypothetical protein